jgi:hypothetical protein
MNLPTARYSVRAGLIDEAITSLAWDSFSVSISLNNIKYTPIFELWRMKFALLARRIPIPGHLTSPHSPHPADVRRRRMAYHRGNV